MEAGTAAQSIETVPVFGATDKRMQSWASGIPAT
jgi:hypothetical protein